MNQLAAKPAFEFVLSILNGKDKGAVYKMLSPRISIGRADDNDICITNDPKISRYHASLTVSAHGVEIRGISDKNKVFVDDKPQNIGLILPGSIIQLGETKIKFDIDNPKNEIASSRGPSGISAGSGQSRRKKSGKKADPGKVRFYAILGAVLIGFAYLLSTDTGIKMEEAKLKTSDMAKNQIEKNREVVAELQKQKRENGTNTEEYQAAESLYIQGFRDHQKGQYERAKNKFEACLAIFPSHQGCNNYYKESLTKLSELIQYYLNLGYEYQSKNQFRQCVSAFNNVMFLEKDKTSIVFREADAGRGACSEALK